ncbi:30S ribosome-binding factor RbfA [Paracoccaceae bacterium]|nr:30S ribosome-binding factor RbfA [Paracoccaceae bacterium]
MQKRKIKGRVGNEASQRQLRVSELIKRNISKILMDSNFYDNNRKNYSASVSEVRCSADLKIAIVYVLPLNHTDPKELTSFLDKNKGAIRYALGKELSLKYLPDLKFKEDTLFKQIEKTKQIFRALEKE